MPEETSNFGVNLEKSVNNKLILMGKERWTDFSDRVKLILTPKAKETGLRLVLYMETAKHNNSAWDLGLLL